MQPSPPSFYLEDDLRSVPFQLEYFNFGLCSYGDLKGCLREFLLSQKHIPSLHLGSDSMALNEEALPQLTHLRVSGTHECHWHLARNRPVTRLHAHAVCTHNISDLFTVIGQAAVPLQLLWYTDLMQCWDEFSETVALAGAATVVSNLRYPVLKASKPHDSRSIALFSNLEELVVEERATNATVTEAQRMNERDFFGIYSKSCAVLCKVTFLYHIVAGDIASFNSYRRKVGEDWNIAEEMHRVKSLNKMQHLFPAMPYKSHN